MYQKLWHLTSNSQIVFCNFLMFEVISSLTNILLVNSRVTLSSIKESTRILYNLKTSKASGCLHTIAQELSDENLTSPYLEQTVTP